MRARRLCSIGTKCQAEGSGTLHDTRTATFMLNSTTSKVGYCIEEPHLLQPTLTPLLRHTDTATLPLAWLTSRSSSRALRPGAPTMSAGSSPQDRPGRISEDALHKRPSPGNRVAGRNILILREARLPGLAFGLEPVHKVVLERSCRLVFVSETVCFPIHACYFLRFLAVRRARWSRVPARLRVSSCVYVGAPVINSMPGASAQRVV